MPVYHVKLADVHLDPTVQHTIGWEPGNHGKGILFRDGLVHTWNTGTDNKGTPFDLEGFAPFDEDDGWPFHEEYISRHPELAQRLTQHALKPEQFFSIRPDGVATFGDQYLDHMKTVDPRMTKLNQQEGWRFGAHELNVIEGTTPAQLGVHGQRPEMHWMDRRPYVHDEEGTVYLGQPGTHHADVIMEFALPLTLHGNWGTVYDDSKHVRGQDQDIENALAKHLGYLNSWDYEEQESNPEQWKLGAIEDLEPIDCPTCHGEGVVGEDMLDCPTCFGDGFLPWLYHVAPTQERARIMTHGLQPSLPSASGNWPDTPGVRQQPSGVYLTTWDNAFIDPETPEEFPLQVRGDENYDIWRVHPSAVEDLRRDRAWNEHHYTPDPIDPEHLALAEGPEHRLRTGSSLNPFKPLQHEPVQYEQPAQPGQMCRFHPDTPAVMIGGFAPMCQTCAQRWQQHSPTLTSDPDTATLASSNLSIARELANPATELKKLGEHFRKVTEIDIEPWQPGVEGKAAVYGSQDHPYVLIWAAPNGSPHHYDVMKDSPNFIACEITPEGEVSVAFGDPTAAEAVVAKDPRLKLAPGGSSAWKLGADEMQFKPFGQQELGDYQKVKDLKIWPSEVKPQDLESNTRVVALKDGRWLTGMGHHEWMMRHADVTMDQVEKMGVVSMMNDRIIWLNDDAFAMRMNWTFGHTSAANVTWTPGTAGKWIIMPGNRVLAWSVDDRGGPHHGDALYNYGYNTDEHVDDAWVYWPAGYIHIDGTVEPEYGSKSDEAVDVVISQVPGTSKREDAPRFTAFDLSNLPIIPSGYGGGIVTKDGQVHTWDSIAEGDQGAHIDQMHKRGITPDDVERYLGYNKYNGWRDYTEEYANAYRDIYNQNFGTDWHFGKVANMGWTPGGYGKATLFDGVLHTWNVNDEDGLPTHYDYGKRQGWDFNSISHSDWHISPDGTTMMIGAHPAEDEDGETDEIDYEDHAAQVRAQDPRLKTIDQTDDWHFGATHGTPHPYGVMIEVDGNQYWGRVTSNGEDALDDYHAEVARLYGLTPEQIARATFYRSGKDGDTPFVVAKPGGIEWGDTATRVKQESALWREHGPKGWTFAKTAAVPPRVIKVKPTNPPNPDWADRQVYIYTPHNNKLLIGEPGMHHSDLMAHPEYERPPYLRVHPDTGEVVTDPVASEWRYHFPEGPSIQGWVEGPMDWWNSGPNFKSWGNYELPDHVIETLRPHVSPHLQKYMPQPKGEEIDGWRFANVHEVNYKPGQFHKGLIEPDTGTVHIWPVTNGEPHHQEYIEDHDRLARDVDTLSGSETDWYKDHNMFTVDNHGVAKSVQGQQLPEEFLIQYGIIVDNSADNDWRYGAIKWDVQDSDVTPEQSYLADVAWAYTHSPFIADPSDGTIYLGQPGVHHHDLVERHMPPGTSLNTDVYFGAINNGRVGVGRGDEHEHAIGEAVSKHTGVPYDNPDPESWRFGARLDQTSDPKLNPPSTSVIRVVGDKDYWGDAWEREMHAEVAVKHGLTNEQLANAVFGFTNNAGELYWLTDNPSETRDRMHDETDLWEESGWTFGAATLASARQGAQWEFVGEGDAQTRVVMLSDGTIIEGDEPSHVMLMAVNGIHPQDVKQLGWKTPQGYTWTKYWSDAKQDWMMRLGTSAPNTPTLGNTRPTHPACSPPRARTAGAGLEPKAFMLQDGSIIETLAEYHVDALDDLGLDWSDVKLFGWPEGDGYRWQTLSTVSEATGVLPEVIAPTGLGVGLPRSTQGLRQPASASGLIPLGPWADNRPSGKEFLTFRDSRYEAHRAENGNSDMNARVLASGSHGAEVLVPPSRGFDRFSPPVEGRPFKGIVLANGDRYVWAVDGYASAPHHPAALTALGLGPDAAIDFLWGPKWGEQEVSMPWKFGTHEENLTSQAVTVTKDRVFIGLPGSYHSDLGESGFQGRLYEDGIDWYDDDIPDEVHQRVEAEVGRPLERIPFQQGPEAWRFGHLSSTPGQLPPNARPWAPGEWGKGVVVDGNRAYEWNSTLEEDPHHDDVLDDLADHPDHDYSELSSMYMITPEGAFLNHGEEEHLDDRNLAAITGRKPSRKQNWTFGSYKTAGKWAWIEGLEPRRWTDTEYDDYEELDYDLMPHHEMLLNLARQHPKLNLNYNWRDYGEIQRALAESGLGWAVGINDDGYLQEYASANVTPEKLAEVMGEQVLTHKDEWGDATNMYGHEWRFGSHIRNASGYRVVEYPRTFTDEEYDELGVTDEHGPMPPERRAFYVDDNDVILLGQNGSIHNDLADPETGDLHEGWRGSIYGNEIEFFDEHPEHPKSSVIDTLSQHLGRPLTETRGWRFGATPHSLLWQPGTNGRYIVEADKVWTWTFDENGDPDHWDYVIEHNINSGGPIAYGYIGRDGTPRGPKADYVAQVMNTTTAEDGDGWHFGAQEYPCPDCGTTMTPYQMPLAGGGFGEPMLQCPHCMYVTDFEDAEETLKTRYEIPQSWLRDPMEELYDRPSGLAWGDSRNSSMHPDFKFGSQPLTLRYLKGLPNGAIEETGDLPYQADHSMIVNPETREVVYGDESVHHQDLMNHVGDPQWQGKWMPAYVYDGTFGTEGGRHGGYHPFMDEVYKHFNALHTGLGEPPLHYLREDDDQGWKFAAEAIPMPPLIRYVDPGVDIMGSGSEWAGRLPLFWHQDSNVVYVGPPNSTHAQVIEKAGLGHYTNHSDGWTGWGWIGYNPEYGNRGENMGNQTYGWYSPVPQHVYEEVAKHFDLGGDYAPQDMSDWRFGGITIIPGAQPSKPGKRGLVMHDGRHIEWDTDETGYPYHAVYMLEHGIHPVDVLSYIYTDHNGEWQEGGSEFDDWTTDDQPEGGWRYAANGWTVVPVQADPDAWYIDENEEKMERNQQRIPFIFDVPTQTIYVGPPGHYHSDLNSPVQPSFDNTGWMRGTGVHLYNLWLPDGVAAAIKSALGAGGQPEADAGWNFEAALA